LKAPHPLENAVLEIRTAAAFESLAIEIFKFQYNTNEVYRQFCDHLGRPASSVRKVSEIPYFPIELFKRHEVISGKLKDIPELVFTSSGTTGDETSRHFVYRPELYEASFLKTFELFYGDVRKYRILALLPSYIERGGSSLVYMADRLIRESRHRDSGFFLENRDQLSEILKKKTRAKTLLIGVSYALLDLLEDGPLSLKNTIVMETGGMKGRRKEITRAELHDQLAAGFGVPYIHSEYGMTELLSQAYARKDGLFETPPWMQIHIREANDPLSSAPTGRTGGVNIIDLANLYSCSFIATSDLGRKHSSGKTEILGRFDYSDMRGCNLMVGFS
jgi:hypothetical protein